MLALLKFSSIAARSKLPPIGLALVAAVAIGAVAIFVPEILGSGVDEINIIFDGLYARLLILLVILKILATSFCVRLDYLEEFSPAAMIGAASGGLLGKLFAVLVL